MNKLSENDFAREQVGMIVHRREQEALGTDHPDKVRVWSDLTEEAQDVRRHIGSGVLKWVEQNYKLVRRHMPSQEGCLKTTVSTKFDWKDRLRILVKGEVEFSVSVPVACTTTTGPTTTQIFVSSVFPDAPPVMEAGGFTQVEWTGH